jgi:hypothetical protein
MPPAPRGCALRGEKGAPSCQPPGRRAWSGTGTWTGCTPHCRRRRGWRQVNSVAAHCSGYSDAFVPRWPPIRAALVLSCSPVCDVRRVNLERIAVQGQVGHISCWASGSREAQSKRNLRRSSKTQKQLGETGFLPGRFPFQENSNISRGTFPHPCLRPHRRHAHFSFSPTMNFIFVRSVLHSHGKLHQAGSGKQRAILRGGGSAPQPCDASPRRYPAAPGAACSCAVSASIGAGARDDR